MVAPGAWMNLQHEAVIHRHARLDTDRRGLSRRIEFGFHRNTRGLLPDITIKNIGFKTQATAILVRSKLHRHGHLERLAQQGRAPGTPQGKRTAAHSGTQQQNPRSRMVK